MQSEEQRDGSAIGRIPALDGIRGIAILLVLMLHFGVAANFPARGTSAVFAWANRVFYAGWIGVDLFFVLSGFLITSILAASRDDAHYFRSFYGRRALRIFPLYYSALAIGLLVLPRAIPQWPDLFSEARAHQRWLWTYTLNIGTSFGLVGGMGLFAHFWTLAIEEQYYLVWPWLVRLVTRRLLPFVCLGLAIVSLAVRLAWLALGYSWEGAYEFTLARVDALAVGSALALLAADARARATLSRVAPAILTGGLLALCVIFLRVPVFYPSEWIVVTFGHTILAFTFAALIVVGIREPAPRWLGAPALRNLGKYSYGLYVWHFPAHLLLKNAYAAYPSSIVAGVTGGVAFVAIGCAISYALAWTSWRVIEHPFLPLKRYFPYRPSRPSSSVDSAPVSGKGDGVLLQES